MHFMQILPSSGSVIYMKSLRIKLYDKESRHQKYQVQTQHGL